MYDMGMNEKDIMTLAGHSNVATTRHYNRRLKEVVVEHAEPEQRGSEITSQ